MNDRRVVAILGTLDTKGEEIRYVRDLVEAAGHRGLLIDTSALGESPPYADVSRNAVAKAGSIGKRSLPRLDRGRATDVMRKGACAIVQRLHRERKIDAIIALGGSGGTSIALAPLAHLPVGFPKVLVTSLSLNALGSAVDGTDIMVVNAVTDILGLNSVNRRVFENAVAAITAMVGKRPTDIPRKGHVGVSAFGITTPAVMTAKAILEREGYDVLVFSSNGVGGRTLERLTWEGVLSAVLDLTITELADEVAGGLLSAGPARLEAPGRRAVPHVVAPGGIDVVNFRASQPVPPHLRRRHFYRHSQITLLMRTSVSESRRLGRLVALKLNRARGPVAVLLPLRGFSAYDKRGKAFFNPKADLAFIKALERHLAPRVEVIELNCHINDEEFGRAAAWKLLEFMRMDARQGAEGPPPSNVKRGGAV
jgi:uncharacterized protein (UPF0261 family)